MFKFNIINFIRSDSLYKQGMLPMCHTKARGWHRNDASYDIEYFQSDPSLFLNMFASAGKAPLKMTTHYYTLSWRY